VNLPRRELRAALSVTAILTALTLLATHTPPAFAVTLYEQVMRCESRDRSEQFCAAQIDGRVRLVRQLGATRCQEGVNWRYTSRGIYVARACRAEFAFQTLGGISSAAGLAARAGTDWSRAEPLRCNSQPGREQFCAARNAGRVRLVEEFGERQCRLGGSWRYTSAGIHVRNGCAGQFEYLPPERATETRALGGWETFAMRCGTTRDEYEQCWVDVRGRVDLLRQYGRRPCIRNWTWGTTRAAIWVGEGCRGEFRVQGFRVDRQPVRGKGSAPPGVKRVPPRD